MQEGMVPYDIKLQVEGDITVAVYFGIFGMGERLKTTKPDLAYCFHTSFVGTGIERINVPQLDVSDDSLFTKDTARTFFLDMQLTECEEAPVEADDMDEMDISCDVQHWHNKWVETMDKRYKHKQARV